MNHEKIFRRVLYTPVWKIWQPSLQYYIPSSQSLSLENMEAILQN